MLHKETVEPDTLGLLEEMMQIDEIKPFALLGGTSLALRWGHRTSEDLDFFSNSFFDEEVILDALRDNFKEIDIIRVQKQTVSVFVNKIKVEFIAPKRPYLKPIEEIENIRFFSAEDAMAFKMNAIERRGSKKDFYDLNEALKYFSLNDLTEFYKKKFETENIFHLLKSITYFEDAETQPEPNITTKTTWINVKRNIMTAFDNQK